MAVVLFVAALALLSLPGLARPLGRRLQPSEWARLSAAALIGGALTLETALVVLAAPTVLRALGVPALAAACSRMMGGLALGGAVVGWAAAVVALAVPALAWRGLARARTTHRLARAEPWVGTHRDAGPYDLVILDSDKVLAASVAGRRDQVLLTTALVASLSAEQLTAVVRHEEAHLAARHQSLLVVAAVVDSAFGLFPAVRTSTAALRLALERWADEEAAGTSLAERQTVRDALLGMAEAMVAAPEIAAFSASLENLVERALALDVDPPPPCRPAQVAVWSPTLGLAMLGLVSFGNWLGQARMMLAMAGLCRA